jgi:hypothetical protein
LVIRITLPWTERDWGLRVYDDVRLVVENFAYTDDVGALLAAGLPPPQQCPAHLLPHLAQERVRRAGRPGDRGRHRGHGG